MNWNWDHLRFFLSLADAGSLSRAAKILGVSHTTVLRRVRAIESELETHLFDHTSTGHKLTPAGQSLYEEVKKMKLAMDNIARQIGGVDQLIEGPVVITTTDTLGHHFLPPVICDLCEQYPELDITLRISNQMSDMPNREADIALRTCVSPPPQLIGRKVGTIHFTACASADYASRHQLDGFPESTADHRFIVLDSGFTETPFFHWLDEQREETTSTVIANGLLTAYRLCAAGAGITVLPTYLVDSDPSLQALEGQSEIASNDLWLLSHVDLRDTARIRLVKRFLYDALQGVFGSVN
ncbi:MAG: LysR family transcriptional regulator [Granulosicoccus sp.]|nr:LysR family transcriptional regulator [Granulosicoccus sp.]